MVAVATRHGMVVVGYSTLSGWPFAFSPTSDPIVQSVAFEHRRSPSQVLLRWALQRGVLSIPRASTSEHVAENRHIFDFRLSEEEERLISTLAALVSSKFNRAASTLVS
jgi:diketogulonate reductase-like aldo/keto reductase